MYIVRQIVSAQNAAAISPNFLCIAGQPIPGHNVVSRSSEDASAYGGEHTPSLGFGTDSIMRRERDHYFRSLKRSPAPVGMSGVSGKARDHYFRSLKRASESASESESSSEEHPLSVRMKETDVTADDVLMCVNAVKRKKTAAAKAAAAIYNQ